MPICLTMFIIGRYPIANPIIGATLHYVFSCMPLSLLSVSHFPPPFSSAFLCLSSAFPLLPSASLLFSSFSPVFPVLPACNPHLSGPVLLSYTFHSYSVLVEWAGGAGRRGGCFPKDDWNL